MATSPPASASDPAPMPAAEATTLLGATLTARPNPTAPAPVDAPPTATLSLTDDERREQAVAGPRFGTCSGFTLTVEEGRATIEHAVLWAQVTVIADVREIGGARYSVPSGDLIGERPVGWYDVYRPTLVTIEHVAHGGPIDDVIKVRLPGGRLGCDTYYFDRTQVADGVGRYVMFLSSEPDVRGNEVPELTVVRAWPVNDAGEVVTPHDGTVSIEEFIRRANGDDV